uniref:G-protein coupled receptors family 1 profile domain-containing protein n=1 Tax=Equus asinus TaxID=9793 RepID=A0A9L0IVN3_EQUAS
MEELEQSPESYTEHGVEIFKIGLFLFILIVLIFLMALFGNLSMIHLIFLDTQLHTPMYFLLSQLSIIDLNYISTIVPKMVSNYFLGKKSISFIGCGVQSFLFLTLAVAEALLLTSMAYDHYVAICFPLHYPIHMSKRVCVLMIIGSWTMALQIPYCQSRAINHFLCDIPAMLTLALFVSTTLFLVLPFIGIACSYGQVLLVVHHMHSPEGRKKANSTCSTHLTVVTFYYAPFVYTYLHPRSLRSPTEDKVLAVFYTILTPMLNPIIYSLRNREVMGALRRVIQRICAVKNVGRAFCMCSQDLDTSSCISVQ